MSTPTATGGARTPIVNTVSVAATSSSWTTVGSFPMGDTLTISASGTAAHYRDGNYGPDGFLTTPTSCGITVGTVTYPCGALLGTFNPGVTGSTFLIGSGTSIIVSSTGTLSVLFKDLQGLMLTARATTPITSGRTASPPRTDRPRSFRRTLTACRRMAGTPGPWTFCTALHRHELPRSASPSIPLVPRSSSC